MMETASTALGLALGRSTDMSGRSMGAPLGALIGVAVVLNVWPSSSVASAALLEASEQRPISAPALSAADRERAARSLVTMHVITLFRERGVLDSQQQARLAALERDLVEARAALAGVISSASAEKTQAEGRILAAREALDREASLLTAQNQALRSLVEAFQVETLAVAAQLSDEELRLRQLVADGANVDLDLLARLADEQRSLLRTLRMPEAGESSRALMRSR
jgi:hypothetical protein